MKITADWIRRHGACQDGAAWGTKTVGDGMELSKLLTLFERADWMLWTLGKSETLTRKQLVRLACVCASTSLKHVPGGERRPRKAIAVALKWTVGDATIQDVQDAASDAAASSAAYTAYAAAYAAASAAYTAYTAYAAARAASAAAARAASAASDAAAAKLKAHHTMCSLMLREMRSEAFEMARKGE